MLDPKERSRRGETAKSRLLNEASAEPATLFEESWRDYVFSEVWERPSLPLRARYLISISGAANAGDQEMTDRYVRGALAGGHLRVGEMREASLHVAVYSGWSTGARVDRAITAACHALGLADERRPAIRAEPWDPAERHAEGGANFTKVMTFGGPPPQTAFFDGGILNFVFGEMWTRPGLDEVSRRWLTLTGVCDASARTPIRSHIYAAMKSGNASPEEMFEFVLQYAIHAGWPRASVVQAAVIEQAEQVAKGLPFEY